MESFGLREDPIAQGETIRKLKKDLRDSQKENEQLKKMVDLATDARKDSQKAMMKIEDSNRRLFGTLEALQSDNESLRHANEFLRNERKRYEVGLDWLKGNLPNQMKDRILDVLHSENCSDSLSCAEEASSQGESDDKGIIPLPHDLKSFFAEVQSIAESYGLRLLDETTLDDLQVKAEDGDPESQVIVSIRCYEEGKLTSARIWAEEAAARSPLGKLLLGAYYHDSGYAEEVQRSYRIISDCAEQQVQGTDMLLATMLYFGRGTRRSLEGAMKHYRIAAEQGDARAMANIAAVLRDMDDPGSDEEAAAWMRKSAELKDAIAQFAFGVMSFEGRGVAKSYEEAAKWIGMAADQGLPDAQYWLGMMYIEGKGVEESEEEGMSLLKMAAENGSSGAQADLGRIYEEEQFSIEKAAECYKMAADQGDAWAMWQLGTLIDDHNYTELNGYGDAAYWYRRAAETDRSQYLWLLVEMHDEGINGEPPEVAFDSLMEIAE